MSGMCPSETWALDVIICQTSLNYNLQGYLLLHQQYCLWAVFYLRGLLAYLLETNEYRPFNYLAFYLCAQSQSVDCYIVINRIAPDRKATSFCQRCCKICKGAKTERFCTEILASCTILKIYKIRWARSGIKRIGLSELSD